MDPQLFSIIMVTRNRPASLEKCLALTRAVLPPAVSIIVFDDASTDAKRIRAIIDSQPNTLYLRSETLVGPGEGRNRCIQAATTAYCFSIDDDCYLDTVPDLSRWLAERPEDRDIAAVGFRYCNLPAGDLAPATNAPGESNSFMGGCSLLRRSAMLRTGGYLDWLGFAREDTELAMRLRRLGYRIWYDPAVIVQHARSIEGRDQGQNSLYVRNTIVINAIHGGWFTGVSLGIAKAMRLGLCSADRRSATWAGIWAGVRILPKCFRARREIFSKDHEFLRSGRINRFSKQRKHWRMF